MEFELIDDITGEEEIEEPTQDDEEFESRWFHGGDFPNLHFTDESCYIWVVLDNGGEDLDLYSLGNGPASTDHWLYDELSYNGWSCIISPEHKTIDSGEGWVFVQSWTNWAMRQGVAPGQPFLLQLDKPNWFQCNSYMDPVEWDVEYSWEITYIIPMSQEETLKAWEGWLKDWEEYTSEVKRRMAELNHKQVTDLEAMYIRIDRYWPDRYDEMTPPTGLIMQLCSNHTQVHGTLKSSWGVLASVRDGQGDWGRAREELKKLCLERIEGVTEEVFNGLKVKR